MTLTHGEWLDADGDLTTAHLDVDLPIFPERLPLGQVDEVVPAGDGDVFEPRFTTHGFRYVRIQGQPGPFGPHDVTGVVVHSDLRRLGWFSCSDDRVSRLHEAVVWSLRSNMCDIPTDCPQRERAGWTGDWQIFAPTAAYLYDVLAFTRKWLGDVSLDQRADGCVANISPCPPAEGFDGRLGALNGSAGWGDVVVSAPWDLYQAYGDTSLLRETWGTMTAWAGFAAAAAAGGRHPDRAAARPEPAAHERYLWDTGFHWGEWLEPGGAPADFGAFARADKSEVATAYLHRSAATVVRVAEVLGLPGEQWHRYREIAAGALDAWRREFVRPDGTLAVQTQASHVRALAFGLVPEELRRPVAARLAELVGLADGHLTTGFLSTPYLLPVLADHGYLEVAYRAAAPGHAAVLAHHGGPGRDDRMGGMGRRRRARCPARLAQPLQQGRGGGLPAPLRRRAAPGFAGIPDLRRASATGWRDHLGYREAHQPVRPHRGVLAAARPARWSSTCWSRRAPRRPSPCPASRRCPASPGRHRWTSHGRWRGFMIVSGFGRLFVPNCPRS